MEYVDIPELQKRGIVKMNEKVDSEDDSGYFNVAATPAQESESPLAFLDTFASSASQDSASTDSGFASAPIQSASPVDMQDMKVKLDDFEYKLDRLVDKLAMIELKLQEFEGKVG